MLPDGSINHGEPIVVRANNLLGRLDEEDENACNVIDDEEEALDALKARQADQALKLKESQLQILSKIH